MKRSLTLIESLIVLILISFILAIALPKATMLNDNTLNLAGRHLISNLNYIRSLAIKNQTNYVVEFSLSENSYKVKLNNIVIKSPHHTGIYEETFSNSAYHGVEFLSANFNGINKLEFTSTGKLINNGNIILRYNNQQITLTPHVLTGKFDVQ